MSAPAPPTARDLGPPDAVSLSRSASVAWRAAKDLCPRNPRGDCSWYHGPWQLFRLLDVVTAPPAHERFLSEACASIARGGGSRVLVSGSADDSLFALVLGAFRRQGVEPRVTVVDLCETPLLLCRSRAEAEAGSLTTHAGDILRFETEERFDLVCAHSFLGYFTRDERCSLATRWRRMLAPGGLFTTVHRIRPDARGETLGFTPEQAAAFEAAVERRASGYASLSGVDAAALAKAARVYASKFRIRSVHSTTEIADALAAGGLQATFEDLDSPIVETDPRPEGPTAPGGAHYVGVSARST